MSVHLSVVFNNINMSRCNDNISDILKETKLSLESCAAVYESSSFRTIYTPSPSPAVVTAFTCYAKLDAST